MSVSTETAPHGTHVVSHRERLEQALEHLVTDDSITGAVVVSRDGIRILDLWKREMGSPETFSAMCATLMGAAEIAFAELGVTRPRRVVAETETGYIVVAGVSADLLLVLHADGTTPLDRLLARVDDAAANVARIATAK